MGDEAREAIEDRPGNIERIARPPNHHRHRPGLCAVVAAADRSVEDMYSARSRSLVEPDHRLGQQGGMNRQHRTRTHRIRSEEHTSELQSLMRISYAVFCLKKKTQNIQRQQQYQKQITR